MNRTKMELLSPAGSYDCLVAAVQNGADAVYFGGGEYNARRSAANFSNDDIRKAIDYCRIRGVKSYITLNTLLFDRELAGAVEFAYQLSQMGCDAVIVQDLGLAEILRRELPWLKLHASTQMGVHSIGGLNYCLHNGFSRVVLARETPLKQIQSLSANTDIELEFFCHGALCMSFSGSCLYSSMSGERSGNRGLCAQPCRKNASVVNANPSEYALSPNDICMLDKLNALRDAGICCIKIEGRMKQPEYVATVTRIYRRALDGQPSKTAKQELFEIFNRGDFSTAHLMGDSVKTGRTGSAKPTKELLSVARASMSGEARRLAVHAALFIERDYPSRLQFEYGELVAEAVGKTVAIPEKPIDRARCIEQIGKLGGTPFTITDCTIVGDGYLPIGELNALRRNAIDSLTQKLLHTNPLPDSNINDIVEGYKNPESVSAVAQTMVYARVNELQNIETAISSGANIVAYEAVCPSRVDIERISRLRAKYSSVKLVVVLPNVLITNAAAMDYVRLIESGVFDGAELNNIGQLELAMELSIRIAGVGLNITNGAAAKKLLSAGFTHFMPSIELTRGQTEGLIAKYGEHMVLNVYGYAPLMQLLHCPVREYRGCQGCNGSVGYIKDEEGRRFRLNNIRFSDGGCLVSMKNCDVTDIISLAQSAGKVYAYAIGIDEIPNQEIDSIIKRTIACCNGEQSAFQSDQRGFTRGHWNRRVL